MKGSRTKDQKKAEVIEHKLNNPDITLREIEELTGIEQSTSSRIINKELQEVAKSSDRIAAFIDSNDRLISIGQKMLETYVPAVEIEGMTDLKALSGILDTAFKQNQLVKGEATERHEVNVKDVSSKTDEELDEFLKSKLSK